MKKKIIEEINKDRGLPFSENFEEFKKCIVNHMERTYGNEKYYLKKEFDIEEDIIVYVSSTKNTKIEYSFTNGILDDIHIYVKSPTRFLKNISCELIGEFINEENYINWDYDYSDKNYKLYFDYKKQSNYYEILLQDFEEKVLSYLDIEKSKHGRNVITFAKYGWNGFKHWGIISVLFWLDSYMGGVTRKVKYHILGLIEEHYEDNDFKKEAIEKLESIEILTMDKFIEFYEKYKQKKW